MLISTSSLSIPVGGAFRRDGAFDSARPAAGRTERTERADESPARGEITRPRSRASGASALDGSFADSLQNLPSRSRNALQTYLSNGPSIQERLGVELAGVDVFV